MKFCFFSVQNSGQAHSEAGWKVVDLPGSYHSTEFNFPTFPRLSRTKWIVFPD